MPDTPIGGPAIDRALDAGVLIRCPACGALVLPTDNGMWLDHPPNPAGEWVLLRLSTLLMAGLTSAADEAASRFTEHEHGPNDLVAAWPGR